MHINISYYTFDFIVVMILLSIVSYVGLSSFASGLILVMLQLFDIPSSIAKKLGVTFYEYKIGG